MKKKLIIVSSILLFILIGFFIFKPKNDKNVLGSSSEINYTLTDVSTHSTSSNCWTVIDTGVYDITKYISKHPGGNMILSTCGVDGTGLFNGISPMGRMHSAVAKGLLSGMKIGNFKSN